MEAEFYMAILTCLIFGNSGEWTYFNVPRNLFFQKPAEESLSFENKLEMDPQQKMRRGNKGATFVHAVEISLQKKINGLLVSSKCLGQLLKWHLYSRE